MIRSLMILGWLPLAAAAQSSATPPARPLRLAIAGLAHGHVSGFLSTALRRPQDVQLVGVWEPVAALGTRYADRRQNGFPASLLYTDLGKMLDTVKPEAVATFTDTFDHAMVVEACAQRHIPVMMEKPLAVNMQQARAIQQASQRTGTPVIVNYETTWYRSHAEIWKLIKEQKAAGDIRRMVAMDGHQGPKEIHVQPEFLAWLTDPVKNGAGALFDFGCYGANLMTWLMDNQRPLKVTALAQTEKPQIYAHVDDEATVLLEYPKAQGIIQASWNWPFSRKDFEVYGEHGYAIATGGNNLRVKMAERQPEETQTTLPDLPAGEQDSISYLTSVVRGRIKPEGLSSLENNMIVVEILDAARESIRTGRTVTLK
ncbi:MAG TPA: Gfo/Idh/MocA family oxidoreductase [Bryobacteraceae bacterium]|nr:Gfo/Idh/MocA family oxidoreductase [Bryobacteraceae bacterium]